MLKYSVLFFLLLTGSGSSCAAEQTAQDDTASPDTSLSQVIDSLICPEKYDQTYRPFYIDSMNITECALINLYWDDAFEKMLPIIYTLLIEELPTSYQEEVTHIRKMFEALPSKEEKYAYLSRCIYEESLREDRAAQLFSTIATVAQATRDAFNQEAFCRMNTLLLHYKDGTMPERYLERIRACHHSQYTLRSLHTKHYPRPEKASCASYLSVLSYQALQDIMMTSCYHTTKKETKGVPPLWGGNRFISCNTIPLQQREQKAFESENNISKITHPLQEKLLSERILTVFIKGYCEGYRLFSIICRKPNAPETARRSYALAYSNRLWAFQFPTLIQMKTTLPYTGKAKELYQALLASYRITLDDSLHELLINISEKNQDEINRYCSSRLLAHCKSFILQHFFINALQALKTVTYNSLVWHNTPSMLAPHFCIPSCIIPPFKHLHNAPQEQETPGQ